MPAAATMRPPRAGPTARARLKLVPLSATAAESSERGTSSGTMACQAGAFMAAPRPRAKVKVNKTHGVVPPTRLRIPSTVALTSSQPRVQSNSSRRSTMSASAPASSPTRNTGKLVAAYTKAIMVGEAVSEVINHAAPTLCIQVPTFEMTVAIHSMRNSECRSGLQAEAAAGCSAVCGIGAGEAPCHCGA